MKLLALELNLIYNMDCREGLKLLEDNSIDSIVTDPPYELGFMGKKWDSTGIAYNIELWQEVLRVLKPGGHLLAFGGTRTYHRMACAIEDAGFEIRDQMQWIYGSGFPKSYNLAKGIEGKLTLGSASWNNWKTLNGEKETVSWGYSKLQSEQKYRPNDYTEKNKQRVGKVNYSAEAAIQWDGWGTALKPANEPIVVARKPLSEKTVAENVLKWGTGGINIDDCRIEYDMTDTNPATNPLYRKENGYKIMCGNDNDGSSFRIKPEPMEMNVNNRGRFPANVILDEEAGRMLDEQSGITKSGGTTTKGAKNNWGNPRTPLNNIPPSVGGASRFFYCAKASKKERGEGNNHPTVKPIKLIEYLIKLVTPPNGVCLDPFEGSGTHALACINLGFNFIGFELNKDYYNIAIARINHAKQHTRQISLIE